jgi:hypothetical protein
MHEHVGRDWDYFQVLKVACLSGFFRGWVASKAKNLEQPTEKEPKEEMEFGP